MDQPSRRDLFAPLAGGALALGLLASVAAAPSGEGAALAVKRAAEAGDPAAMDAWSRRLRLGRGVAADAPAARRWAALAGRRGAATALTRLGLMQARGEGGAMDFDAAARQWRRASAMGEPAAAYNLALLYGRGLAQPPSGAEAARLWLGRAAEEGDALASAALRRLGAADGADPERGKPGGLGAFSTPVLLQTAERRRRAGDLDGAILIWRRLAEEGDARAQHRLGVALDVPGADRETRALIHGLFADAAARGYGPARRALVRFVRRLPEAERRLLAAP